MTQVVFHKGSFCCYTSIFCQEGYCAECEIHVKQTSLKARLKRCKAIKSQSARELLLTR
jgi:hypothetical protein